MIPFRLAALLLALSPAAAIPQAQRVPAPAAPARAAMLGVAIVARFPHDRAAFTEGLIWHGDAMYESVGREGASDVRRVRLADGRVMARAAIPPQQFGEGLAAWGRELVSLTWHDGIAHRWDAATLAKRGESRFTGEGWGLTGDGRSLIQSDGTPTLRFLDPATLKERRRITVTLNGRALDQINELEWVDGAILANVWHQPFIVRIDPASGAITRIYDLRSLVKEVGASDPEAVANGIAWNARDRRLFVTGKLWPTLYEITLDR